MLIDWFTVAAQTLNFIILVWLLKRFLYKPILNAIDAREKRIAAELADADARKAEALSEREAFHKKNEQFDHNHAAMMSKVTDEANAERQRLLDDARKAADALSAKRQETLLSDAKVLHQSIRQRTQKEVFAVARKALVDLAAVDLEERMVDVFVQRLQTMESQQKEELMQVFEASDEPMLIRSAFELPNERRTVIESLLRKILSRDVQVQYETVPDLISGVELSVNGHKIAWSLADYLGALEKDVDSLLNGMGNATLQEKPALNGNPE